MNANCSLSVGCVGGSYAKVLLCVFHLLLELFFSYYNLKALKTILINLLPTRANCFLYFHSIFLSRIFFQSKKCFIFNVRWFVCAFPTSLKGAGLN